MSKICSYMLEFCWKFAIFCPIYFFNPWRWRRQTSRRDKKFKQGR